MNDMNRRILITGSTGCIGNHAVDFLLAEEAGLVFGFNRSMPENINEKKDIILFPVIFQTLEVWKRQCLKFNQPM